jgi:hypothetical protein
MKSEEFKEMQKKARYFLAEYSRVRNERRAHEHRLPIINTDPNAPICINCIHCQQTGFLFHCPIYELPEDGKVVGMFGIVYYRRKGHKPITYPDTPMKSKECEAFKPLIM